MSLHFYAAAAPVSLFLHLHPPASDAEVGFLQQGPEQERKRSWTVNHPKGWLSFLTDNVC